MRLTRRGRIVAALVAALIVARLVAALGPLDPCDSAPSTITECYPPLTPSDY